MSNIYNRQNLQDITGLGKDAIGQRIKQLREYRLIINRSRGYTKTAGFINFLDRWIREKDEIHPTHIVKSYGLDDLESRKIDKILDFT